MSYLNNRKIQSLYNFDDVNFDGVGVIQNVSKAYIWFKVATNEENDEYNTRAQLMVGMMHEYGEGARQNMDKALKYYKLSAEQGNIDAQNKLETCKENLECSI